MSVIGRVRRKQEIDEATVQTPIWDYCRVWPSCPPDTRIHVSAQRYVAPPSWGGGYTIYLDADAVDLTSYDSDLYPLYNYKFSNAYYYIGMFVAFNWTQDYQFYGANCTSWSGGGFVEYEKAYEAEASLDAFCCSGITELGFPICRLILRNNGTVNEYGQFMPIDAVNRGRSYIWGEVRKQYTI